MAEPLMKLATEMCSLAFPPKAHRSSTAKGREVGEGGGKRSEWGKESEGERWERGKGWEEG